MGSLLKLENITKKYGKETVLKNVNFELNSGEVVGLVGPNGAGKSTLMKIITGLIYKYDGVAQIEGENIRNMKCDTKKVGCLIENPGYYGSDTGFDNLKFCAKLSGNYSKKQIIDLAKRIDIEYALKKRVSKYSLGMKQKLGICMAMVGNPKILILDEPTNGLDPDTIPLVRNMIKYSAKEKNCAVLVSSHILSEIEVVCDRVYFIRKGQIISSKDIGVEERMIYSFSTDAPLKLVECLRKIGFEATISGNEVEVEMDETKAAEVLSYLVNEKISIFRMDKNTIGLEQTYHNIMEAQK